MLIRAVMVASIAMATVTAARAEEYRFSAVGTVGNPYSVNRNFNPVSTFPTSIQAGDSFSISFDVNPAKFAVTSLYDADPTINIYYGTLSSYRLTIGGYTSVISGDISFASSQLWNNYISGGSPVDYFSINALQTISASSAPITLTSQVIDQVFGFNAFDFTATARNSDLITDITPLTGFGSQSAYIGFIDPNTYDQTTYSINGLRANIMGVPESATWLMIVVGFGLTGRAMRQAKKYTVTSVGSINVKCSSSLRDTSFATST